MDDKSQMLAQLIISRLLKYPFAGTCHRIRKNHCDELFAPP
jgi:hypothetical protein